MGVMLIAAMAGGGVAGLIIGITFVLLAVGLARKTAARRSRVWPVFIGTAFLLALVLVYLVSLIPQAPVKPGSDYDVAMSNYFWTALSPGRSRSTMGDGRVVETYLGKKKS